MVLEFEKKVAGFISASALFGSAKRILLAVSGGADSVALLYVMKALKAKHVFSGELVCCHVNHQLRGAEADLDEEFARGQAEELKLAAVTKRVDVRVFAERSRLSIETAGRKLRMEALIETAKEDGCECVATGHQKNDNAETVVGRLVRGTGFRGLGGIWPVRRFAGRIDFVRPLLCVRRDEIIEYLKGRNLQWRVDHTNFDFTYRRNFIRHRLLPALEGECEGSIVERLFELSRSAQKLHSSICSRAKRLWAEAAECGSNAVALDLERFLTQHPAVQVELVRRALAAMGGGERDVTQRHYETILRLAEENISGREIALPGGFSVRREYGKMIFGRGRKEAETFGEIGESVEVKIPGATRFSGYLIEAAVLEAEKGALEGFRATKKEFVEWFDLDKVVLPVVVRGRAAGDRFVPLGLREEKKVGKFLTAARVPRQAREKALIVADREKIIWVWPVRMSEQAKVTAGTRKILQLRITDVGEG
jgi:tRNA(Ile)-lysidine synthase